MFSLDFRLIYGLGTLILGIFYIIVFLTRKDLRKIILTTSIMIALAGPLSEILFFRDYWNPPSFFNFNILGFRVLPEDILFAFVLPAIAVLYIVIFKNKLSNNTFNLKSYLLRFYLLGIFYIIPFFAITLLSHINSIFASIIMALIVSATILYKRADLINIYVRTSIISILGSSIFYYSYILLIGKSYLYHVWLLNHDLFGLRLFGSVVPLTEVLFAATVIPFITVLMLFSSRLKIK